jgi:hypothetical protein
VEDLVQTLITGFLVSGLFIFIVWWFWRRYDQPSEAQLEREEELAKKKEEQAMWRAVEAQMAEEKAHMEEQALYLRKKAEQTQRAQPPAVGTLNNALEAFGTVAVATTEASHASFEGSVEAPKEATHLDEADLDVEDDRDVLLASAPVDVRQDLGVVAAPAGEVSEPDWALVEKLDQLAKADAVEETPHPELPGAPDLGALATADLPDAPDLDSLGGAVTPPVPDHEDVIQWEHEQQENDPNEWDVEWTSIPDEEE